MENLNQPIMEFAPIYGVDKNGKTKIWKASIHEKDGIAIANIQHGQLSGKLQSSFREYTTGKNIGRKNETTALDQCIQETKRKRQDKLEKEGYKETMDSAHTGGAHTDGSVTMATKDPVLPMLAHKYEPAKNKKNTILFPCFVQPKLDGLRCVAYISENGGDKPTYQSRTGSLFSTMDHINTPVTQFIERIGSTLGCSASAVHLDGELYTDKIPFETLAGLIKKKKLTEEDRAKLREVEYHIYDVYIPNYEAGFSQRWNLLETNYPCSDTRGIQLVKTEKVDLAGFRKKFNEYIQGGYEGIMLRNVEGIYRTNYRSNDLQKYKEFFEDEFEIVGFGEGEGRDQGTIIWNCVTSGGREFSVRPKGTIEYRKELFNNAHKYVGKMLTVIYQELSEQGVPRFPVGKAIRDGY